MKKRPKITLDGKISEREFARICQGITEDRETICKHNPIGTPEEILLWMLLSCLISYLSLSEIETPCFNGKPDAETYRKAILFILKDRKTKNFNVEKYLEQLAKTKNDYRNICLISFSTKHAGCRLRRNSKCDLH